MFYDIIIFGNIVGLIINLKRESCIFIFSFLKALSGPCYYVLLAKKACFLPLKISQKKFRHYVKFKVLFILLSKKTYHLDHISNTGIKTDLITLSMYNWVVQSLKKDDCKN